ncbi:MAG: SCO family protein [Crocinitomicaceae bacterium]
MRNLLFASISLLFFSCSGEQSTEESNSGEKYIPFPIMGEYDLDLIVENGVEKWDTIYHEIPEYVFLNQDSILITNKDLDGKVHVANFFFTSCPSICPAMIAQMQRLQEMTADIDEIMFLSHTIDPDRDTIPKLRNYIEDREIDTKNWHFLYGEREYTHELAKTGYIINAMKDEAAEGGFLHSEYFVLVDRDRRIRGLYDGTNTEEVDQLNEDLRKLIKNEYN